ncbi:MAG TPA: hypothetical protein VFS27_07520 [Blastocatellia bacterium]|jgi:hypothetical protein|nr:hypothetical protein [Blastocatellia bacterium]
MACSPRNAQARRKTGNSRSSVSSSKSGTASMGISFPIKMGRKSCIFSAGGVAVLHEGFGHLYKAKWLYLQALCFQPRDFSNVEVSR